MRFQITNLLLLHEAIERLRPDDALALHPGESDRNLGLALLQNLYPSNPIPQHAGTIRFFFQGKATGVERFWFERAQSSGLEISNVLREGKRTLEFSRPA